MAYCTAPDKKKHRVDFWFIGAFLCPSLFPFLCFRRRIPTDSTCPLPAVVGGAFARSRSLALGPRLLRRRRRPSPHISRVDRPNHTPAAERFDEIRSKSMRACFTFDASAALELPADEQVPRNGEGTTATAFPKKARQAEAVAQKLLTLKAPSRPTMTIDLDSLESISPCGTRMRLPSLAHPCQARPLLATTPSIPIAEWWLGGPKS